jgi:ubiquinone/menaquinone biosynthesis C-methylase UbiE
VRTLVERGEPKPLLQMTQGLFGLGRESGHKVLEDGDVASAKAPPLGHHPAVEVWAAIDFKPIEEVADEQHRKRAQPLKIELLDTHLHRLADIDDIDEAVAEVEPDGVKRRLDPSTIGLVEDRPGLAEAPPKLPARIVGDVPEKLAQVGARQRTRGERQVGDEGAYFARCRKRQRDTVTADRHRPEHPDIDGTPTGSAARWTGFHGRFHARYHARLHGPPLALASTVAARLLRRTREFAVDGQAKSPHEQSPERRTIMAMSNAAISQSREPGPVIDLAGVKARQRGAWSSGDYAVVGTTLQIVGEDLCEALDIRAGQKVLDVAAGNGNVSLAAARRWCDVTATDYVPALLERARERAAAEQLQIEFREADAEALPFEDGTFDAVVSTFGVMFTPDQEKAAAELMRVCKPGGKIGLANWTPEGFIGQLFKTIGKHLPPPAGVKSPALWGAPARVREMFEPHAAAIEMQPRHFVFRYRSPAHWMEVFKTYYGPVLKAFAALEPAAQSALTSDLNALIDRFNRAGDGSMVVPSEYLEIVITRR